MRLPTPSGGRAEVTWHEGDFLALRLPPKEPDEALEWNEADASFDAAFDRGGLVAVVPADRAAYAATLRRLIRPGGRVLFVSVEHPPFGDGRLGPPHSIDEAELRVLVEDHFDVEQLSREDRMDLEPHWAERGCSYFFETTYLLTRTETPPFDGA